MGRNYSNVHRDARKLLELELLARNEEGPVPSMVEGRSALRLTRVVNNCTATETNGMVVCITLLLTEVVTSIFLLLIPKYL